MVRSKQGACSLSDWGGIRNQTFPPKPGSGKHLQVNLAIVFELSAGPGERVRGSEVRTLENRKVRGPGTRNSKSYKSVARNVIFLKLSFSYIFLYFSRDKKSKVRWLNRGKVRGPVR